jgi:hypothetical protein
LEIFIINLYLCNRKSNNSGIKSHKQHTNYLYSTKMKKLTNLLKSLLVVAMLGIGSNAWGDDWSTVWSANFSSAPSGMTYSVTNGSCDISNGYINYQQGGGSGDRAINTAFTDSKFAVDTNWKMEFDWNCGSSNTNTSYVTFATNNGNAFKLTWVKYASGVVVTDASDTELTTTLPLLGYKQATCSSWSHITIIGDTENGIYLTITNGTSTYVDNVLVTSTFGYPKTFNGSFGKTVSSMFIDNIDFATPAVAGYVAPPTGTITAPAGNDRKFTLSCLTDGATIYYADSDLEIGADGWTAYSSEVTTSAATIYAYASDGVNNSEKINFATGAGTAITLNAPVITLSNIAATADIYYPVVTIGNDQSGLALVPASTTLSYEFNGETISASSPYTFIGTGELVVTVSADGYTSNSASYTVNTGYVKTGTIDLAAITENELSTVWTKTSDASQLPADNWISRYSSASYPAYVYDYTNESANKNDVIDGLVVNISSKDADPGVTPTFYVGAGMILPTKKLNASDLSESGTWNTNISVGIAGGTSDQIAVYTYPTNYGFSTSTSVIAGNTNFNLYRYSDMLTKVEIYSPYTSMSIVGDFSANEWDAANGIEMTRDTEDPHIWTAVVKDFVVTSSKYIYKYKATANGKWGVYELGEDDNSSKDQIYNFDYDGAGEGKYTLTFTVNTSTHRVSLAIEKQKTATIYFANTADWTAENIKAYTWNETGNNGWPGEVMTATGTQIDGKDVYEWSTYALDIPTMIIISNNGSNTERTGDQPFVNGFTYDASGNVTITKSITAAGWATLCSPFALDFSGDIENLEAAYIVTGGADNKLIKEKVTGTVPANTGLLLKSKDEVEAEVVIPVVANSDTDVSDNKLVGVTADTNIEAGAGYVLMNDETNGLGFYLNSNAFKVGANTAYLPANFDVTESGARFFLIEGGIATGISDVRSKMEDVRSFYDLQGRRVAQPTKGLYINKGKKVVVK